MLFFNKKTYGKKGKGFNFENMYKVCVLYQPNPFFQAYLFLPFYLLIFSPSQLTDCLLSGHWVRSLSQVIESGHWGFWRLRPFRKFLWTNELGHRRNRGLKKIENLLTFWSDDRYPICTPWACPGGTNFEGEGQSKLSKKERGRILTYVKSTVTFD